MRHYSTLSVLVFIILTVRDGRQTRYTRIWRIVGKLLFLDDFPHFPLRLPLRLLLRVRGYRGVVGRNRAAEHDVTDHSLQALLLVTCCRNSRARAVRRREISTLTSVCCIRRRCRHWCRKFPERWPRSPAEQRLSCGQKFMSTGQIKIPQDFYMECHH